MLTSNEIRKQINLGNIEIENLTTDAFRKPNSCDVRIGNVLYTYKDNMVIDSRDANKYKEEIMNDKPQELIKLPIPETGMLLEPNKLYLTKTVEKVTTHGYIPALYGKVNLSNLGIGIGLNNEYKTDNYNNHLLISIVASKPTIIYPDMVIGNLAFFKKLDPSEKTMESLDYTCGVYPSGMLSGLEIQKRMASESPDIVISPSTNILINPNSVNLTLNEEIGFYKDKVIDIKANNPIEIVKIGDDGYEFKKGELYLARTNEWTETHNLIPMISGRSSLGRNGIHVHSSACMGSIGYEGPWHLAARAVINVIVRRNMQFCQLYYLTPDGIVDQEYSGSMQNLPKEEMGSQLYKTLGKNKRY